MSDAFGKVFGDARGSQGGQQYHEKAELANFVAKFDSRYKTEGIEPLVQVVLKSGEWTSHHPELTNRQTALALAPLFSRDFALDVNSDNSEIQGTLRRLSEAFMGLSVNELASILFSDTTTQAVEAAFVASYLKDDIEFDELSDSVRQALRETMFEQIADKLEEKELGLFSFPQDPMPNQVIAHSNKASFIRAMHNQRSLLQLQYRASMLEQGQGGVSFGMGWGNNRFALAPI